MKVFVARLTAFSLVATSVGYLALAQWESARLNRELEEVTSHSSRLDEMNHRMHQQMCQKLNLPEEVVRYGAR